MTYYIRHRETGLYLVWNESKATDEWQQGRAGATQLTKPQAISKARQLNLTNTHYTITNI